MNIQHFLQITITLETIIAPPPYSHMYQFVVKPQDGLLKIRYQLTYTDRDSITEEEIWEEGFTLHDNYTWEGTLPAVWQQAMLNMLERTTKLKSKPAKEHAGVINLQIQLPEGDVSEGIPDNIEAWEYFLQEMTQAVFELSQKERPLEIHYLEISASGKALSIAIKPLFSIRKLTVEVSDQGKRYSKTPDWDQLKPLLKAIYLPDYDATSAKAQPPAKPGRYIDPGEEKWYELGKGVINPGKQYDAVGALDNEVRKLLIH